MKKFLTICLLTFVLVSFTQKNKTWVCTKCAEYHLDYKCHNTIKCGGYIIDIRDVTYYKPCKKCVCK